MKNPLRAEVFAGKRLLFSAEAGDLATLRERVDSFLAGLKGTGVQAGLRRKRAAKRPQSTRKSR